MHDQVMVLEALEKQLVYLLTLFFTQRYLLWAILDSSMRSRPIPSVNDRAEYTHGHECNVPDSGKGKVCGVCKGVSGRESTSSVGISLESADLRLVELPDLPRGMISLEDDQTRSVDSFSRIPRTDPLVQGAIVCELCLQSR
jgi:hypothetical protein